MRKISLIMLSALSLLTAQQSFAELLSPQQAYSRALNTHTSAKFKAPSVATPVTPQLTVEADGQPACYVFDNTDGYLVVSADDLVPAVLGYADDSAFDADNMPTSLKYWLDSYATQIQWLRANPQATTTAAVSRPQRAAIAPLVKTKWNQNAPFNDLCPLDNGKRSVTGCVATALAQIMNYHQWPDKGSGSKSYTWNSETLSLDYSTITYDWADMLDVYNSSSTDAQKQAVATLMYSCGVSVEMDYSSSESGASSYHVVHAMIDYFGYDKGIEYLPRNCFGIIEWEDELYNQLVKYGPVQYSGQSNDGGHSFVCDGYSSDGYFHINWGWGGMSDGYFLLTALDPGTQGIGGSSSGYNFDQDIIANVQRPTADNSYAYVMIMESDFAVEENSANLGDMITLSGDIYNFSATSISGLLGVKYTSTETGKTYYAANTKMTDLGQLSGYSQFNAHVPKDLPDGTYTVTPAFQVDDKWYDVRTQVSSVGSVTATVADGVATFTSGQPASVDIENITPQSDFYLGSKYYITATAVNTSTTEEYYGPVRAVFIDSTGNLVAVGEQYPLDIPAGESVEVDYVSDWLYFNSTTPDAGTYYLAFADASSVRTTSSYTLVSQPVQVTVNAAASDTEISVTDAHITDGNAVSVDKTDVSVTATVTCTSGYFANTLTLAIFPYTSGSVTSEAMFRTDAIFLGAGESQQVTAHGHFAEGVDGKKYIAVFYKGSTQVSSGVIFTLAAETGIDDVINDHDVYEIFTPAGIKIGESTDTSRLQPGVYILRSGDISKKIVIFAQ